MILYHYTSKVAFDEIMRTGTLRAADPWTTMDKTYGYGWYFTDLTPETCTAWTMAHCWRNVVDFEKASHYLTFDVPDDGVKYCREHVYMLTIWDSRITYIAGKATPLCDKGPCTVCEIMSKAKQFLETQDMNDRMKVHTGPINATACAVSGVFLRETR